MVGKPAAPPSAIETLKLTINKDIKRIKRKYVILKIKWFLLFVLPILLIVVAYQTAKPVSYTHLDVYKRQDKHPLSSVRHGAPQHTASRRHGR